MSAILEYTPENWYGEIIFYRLGGAEAGIIFGSPNKVLKPQLNEAGSAIEWIEEDFENAPSLITKKYWGGDWKEVDKISDPDGPKIKVPSKFVYWQGQSAKDVYPTGDTDFYANALLINGQQANNIGYRIYGAALATDDQGETFIIVASHTTNAGLRWVKCPLSVYQANPNSFFQNATVFATTSYSPDANTETDVSEVLRGPVSFSGDGKKAIWVDNTGMSGPRDGNGTAGGSSFVPIRGERFNGRSGKNVICKATINDSLTNVTLTFEVESASENYHRRYERDDNSEGIARDDSLAPATQTIQQTGTDERIHHLRYSFDFTVMAIYKDDEIRTIKKCVSVDALEDSTSSVSGPIAYYDVDASGAYDTTRTGLGTRTEDYSATQSIQVDVTFEMPDGVDDITYSASRNISVSGQSVGQLTELGRPPGSSFIGNGVVTHQTDTGIWTSDVGSYIFNLDQGYLADSVDDIRDPNTLEFKDENFREYLESGRCDVWHYADMYTDTYIYSICGWKIATSTPETGVFEGVTTKGTPVYREFPALTETAFFEMETYVVDPFAEGTEIYVEHDPTEKKVRTLYANYEGDDENRDQLRDAPVEDFVGFNLWVNVGDFGPFSRASASPPQGPGVDSIVEQIYTGEANTFQDHACMWKPDGQLLDYATLMNGGTMFNQRWSAGISSVFGTKWRFNHWFIDADGIQRFKYATNADFDDVAPDNDQFWPLNEGSL